MTRHFVIFCWPGSFFADNSEPHPVSDWDVTEAMKIARDYKRLPYCFQFLTRERADDDLDSHVSERSGTFYIGGTVFTLDEIRAEHDPNNRILLNNMEGNKWDRVIRVRGWTQPFEEGDHIVDNAGNLIE